MAAGLPPIFPLPAQCQSSTAVNCHRCCAILTKAWVRKISWRREGWGQGDGCDIKGGWPAGQVRTGWVAGWAREWLVYTDRQEALQKGGLKAAGWPSTK